uniref:Corticotropin-releasing factor domain-containing protein n=1 Tax=Anopheles maculatus TaxID=74869 RepID=A0A182S5W6_9DIPT
MNVRLVIVFWCILLHLELAECLPPLFGSAIFGGRVEKPLLALSLESFETATEATLAPADQPDDDEDELYPLEAYQLRRITSSKRFYDMVLGVLHVLESQARQKVQRAREQRENVRSAAYDDEDDQPA